MCKDCNKTIDGLVGGIHIKLYEKQDRKDENLIEIRAYNNNIINIPTCEEGGKVITLSDDITEIGARSFYKRGKLSFVELPYCTSIGESAFEGCVSLKSVRFSTPQKFHNNIVIGGRAFYGCGLLKEILLPDNLTRIGDEAFGDCISLEKLVIPQSVQYIGEGAFGGCVKLKEVIFLGETELDYGTFEGCSSLHTVYVPNGGLFRFNEMFAVQNDCNPEILEIDSD